MREVTGLQDANSLDTMTISELESIRKFCDKQYQKYIDIDSFCGQDHTAYGGVAHKHAIFLWNHYAVLIDRIDNRIKEMS